ncbi:Zn-ribbon domain-containing OB-fold protein [Streptomyces sp. NPDC001617]
MTVGIMQRDPATAEFFDGTARGELLIRRCADCGHHSAPRCETCPACGSAALDRVPAEGTGTIASWTLVHGRPPRDGGPAPVTAVVVVELDEGPWLHSQVITTAPQEVRTGIRVTVEFERPEGGEAIPVFRLAPDTVPA